MTTNGKTNAKTPEQRKAKGPHGIRGGTQEANRLAVVILEVLAGGRTPSEAATALAISVPRYYQLEIRALEGLVAALEPRPKGKQPCLQRRLVQLQKALDEARRECARQQALVRAAQRSLGIKAPATPTAKNAKQPAKDRAGRRRRRPTVRALKAVAALKKNVRPESSEALQQQAPGASGVSSTEDSPAKEHLPSDGRSGKQEGATP